ncbi:hypothetical protein [Calothrix sp. UHCC 0171]|uniref:hypothetical protein n=1 Tax=Calothrix sp. UHCC 0171 TaxID=3110245 RepID=UPI002B204251|nr:hypothetical protein [Calothrix sp. UHCC 0171]MEA5571953.1 hypothetical protein [Calothrix sp. UHCC 0171]
MNNILTNLAIGDIDLITEFVLLLIAIPLSMLGGAIGGILLAGKDFGYNFSAMMGSLLAPAGVIPGVIIGLVLIYILAN